MDFSIIHLPLELVVDAEVAIFLLPDAPCTILSTPIIKRLITANINVRINIPTNRFINSRLHSQNAYKSGKFKKGLKCKQSNLLCIQ